MPDTTTERPEVIDGRKLPHHRGPSIEKLAGMRDLGAVRRVDQTRLRAFELNRPIVFLTLAGEKSAREGDVMLVGKDEIFPVSRDAYERWYEPASEHDDGARGSADAIAAMRLALAAAADDRAAVAAIGQLLSYAPPSDGARVEPVRLLTRAVNEAGALRFELTNEAAASTREGQRVDVERDRVFNSVRRPERPAPGEGRP